MDTPGALKKHDSKELSQISKAIRMACDQRLGVIDSNFLCQTVGVVATKEPFCVGEEVSIEEVITKFREHNVGSMLVVDDSGKLTGIITERDCVCRVLPVYQESKKKPVKAFMTSGITTQPINITIAFALNLMSLGGFRHLPLVDEKGFPVAVVSVRDVMDFIVNSFVEDLLKFKVE